MNTYIDPATKFWTEERDHSAPDRGNYGADVESDVLAAVKDARAKANEQDEIESSRDHIETLRRGFGSVKNGLEQNLALARGYRTDPLTAREWHKRIYYGRMPDVPPAKEQDEQPPADLTPEARDEWERHYAVRKAVRSVERDRAYKAELEAAKPLLDTIRKEYGPLRTSLEQAAAVHEAMSTNPEVANRLSFAAGAPATEWQAAEQRHNAQHRADLGNWFSHVVASGTMPGLERADVQHAVTACLNGMQARGQSSGSVEQDLANAYGAAMTVLKEREAEAADLAAHERVKAKQSKKGRAAKPEGDELDEDITKDVRSAYRAHA